jgi:hypothetical protein
MRFNKWAKLDLMPGMYCVSGVLLTLGGVATLSSQVSKGELSLALLLVFNLILGGAFLMASGMKKYQGDWSTLIGVLLIVFSSFGLDADLDSMAQGQQTDIADTLVICGFFFLNGLLLLLSGQRMHRLATELHALKNAALASSEKGKESPPQ